MGSICLFIYFFICKYHTILQTYLLRLIVPSAPGGALDSKSTPSDPVNNNCIHLVPYMVEAAAGGLPCTNVSKFVSGVLVFVCLVGVPNASPSSGVFQELDVGCAQQSETDVRWLCLLTVIFLCGDSLLHFSCNPDM